MDNTPLTRPEDFPASKKSCYFNAASAALMYSKAATTILDWQQDLAENGTINFDEVAEEQIYFGLHAAAAELVNATDRDIAGGSSATELLTSLAWAMLPSPEQEIISTDAAHPSSVYPWQRVVRQTGCKYLAARADDKGYVDPDQILDMISDNTALVILSHVEYRCGQTYDLKAIAERAHKHGALLVVDATQSAGQLPIDVQDMELDALVSSGYKWLCGPFGAAFMYVAPALQNQLDPGLVGWRSHENMWEFRADRLQYPPSAWRFEASTMAYGCALGLAEAISYLNKVGVEKIFEHNKRIADLIAQELSQRGARVLSPTNDQERSSIISVDFPEKDTRRISDYLNQHNVVVSYRMGAIRISPHLYNVDHDVQTLVETIDQCLEQTGGL